MSGDELGRKPFDLPPWTLPAALAVLTLLLFGDSLIVPGRVPAGLGDLQSQYLPWRQFAFTEIRHGHFPLWNPYAFFGTPFFGDPQSGMLYPPNWLNLFLSPQRAASWLIALHFFLAGYFTGIWCRLRGAGVIAAILAGAIYACSGPIITNIAAGHLPLLCSAAWAPLLLCCVEQAFSAQGRAARRYTLIGIAAAAMLALDGYPQFAYYTALAAGIYAIILLWGSTRKWPGIASVALMFIGGWTIAAGQIIASAQFAGESVRAGGLDLAEASAFSLPPENLLTLLVPGLFGDGRNLPYFGRWAWWETCLFIGPAALALIIFGLSKTRRSIGPAILAAIMFILALGAYTPLFRFLFDFLPGFHDFRATGRFGLLGILFLSLLAATGWDRLQDNPRPARLNALFATSIAIGASAIVAWRGGLHWMLPALAATGQSFELARRIPPDLAGKAAPFIAGQFAIAALVLLITAGLIHSLRRGKAMMILLAIFILGNAAWFGAQQRESTDHPSAPRRSWEIALQSVPDDARVFVAPAWYADAGSTRGFLDIGGYNPLLLNRTARFLAAVEEQPVTQVGQTDPEHIRGRFLRMVRGVWAMPRQPGVAAYPLANPLPHLTLINQFNLTPTPDAALAAVLNRNFNPARGVVLESQPQPPPAGDSQPGKVRLVQQSTDHLEIEADVPSPQLLLITDAYSNGWQARPLDAGDKQIYQVLPADYCLRAIPLAAGHHHFLLEYRPRAVFAGLWISLAATLAYIALWIVHWRC